MPGTATRVVRVRRKSPLKPSTNPGGISETQLPAWIPTGRPDPNIPDDNPWFVVKLPLNGRAFAELREIGANGEIGPVLGPYMARIAEDEFVQIYIADLLAPGSYNVKLYVSDAAGNLSCASSVDVADPECPKDSIPDDDSPHGCGFNGLAVQSALAAFTFERLLDWGRACWAGRQCPAPNRSFTDAGK